MVEKLKRFGELGATRLIVWTQIGGIEHDKLMRSVRLMGEEVMPALRDVHPPKDLGRDFAHPVQVAVATY